jgi:hypothetical protein
MPWMRVLHRLTSTAIPGNSKFQTPKMSAGSVLEFYQGLGGRVGECYISGIEQSRVLSLAARCRRPAPGPCKGCEGRALRQGRRCFDTSNYGVRTNPRKEYEIATGQHACPGKDMLDK